MSAGPEPTTIAARAKRTGVAAIVVAVMYLIMAALAGFGAPGVPEFAVGSITVLVVAVLLLIAGGISFSIASRYPAVKHLAGINDFCVFISVGVGLIGAIAAVVVASDLMSGITIAIVVVLVVFGVYAVTKSNRVALRSPDARVPATGA